MAVYAPGQRELEAICVVDTALRVNLVILVVTIWFRSVIETFVLHTAFFPITPLMVKL
jgi:hypothetical protein